MLTLKDRLSHLTYNQACKLLGPEGKKLLRRGGEYEISIDDHVVLNKNTFKLDLGDIIVSISLDPMRDRHLKFKCSICDHICEHLGAAFSLILEEKLALGLSAPPPERIPVESLTDEELIEQEIADRIERAEKQKMKIRSSDKSVLWTDYSVTNYTSGKTYRVALRGWERGESYCSCPDFRKNTLGTCKHILHTLNKVKNRFPKKIKDTPYIIKDVAVYLYYGKNLELRLLIPGDLDKDSLKILAPFKDNRIKDVAGLVKAIGRLELSGRNVIIYPDAEEYINDFLYRERISSKVNEIRANPAKHPLRKNLLNTDLLPYQMDGIAFAVGRGRAVIADDMGLGKTIQGIGVSELLAQDADISKVLIICPASLKSQWRLEIDRFTDRDCQLILGTAAERAGQYQNDCFFTICNYEQVLRDINTIEQVKWDLIILDEGQRIKNWETKTSQTIKALKSSFALVLTGTPLENRLDELHSIIEFIDDRRLGPAFRFQNQHRITNEKGKLLGYKNLDLLREKLKPVLVRRTRNEVLKQLPPRTTEIRRIIPKEEQLTVHNQNKRVVSQILKKKYISEMDLLRLQKALLICRMAANSTFLVDKQSPGYSSKLEEIDSLLDQLMCEDDRKVVLFSEWTTMLNLIEPILKKKKIDYVRLDGSVPQKKRLGLVSRFQKEPDCRFFITTNAGSTGLNLQAANTVINVDLPWNPAVLEQRIGRAHRMGQKRPVQIFLLVTEDTIEENLLGTLSAKQALFNAALDRSSEADSLDLSAGIDELRRRLEVLTGEKPDAPIDESMKEQSEREARILAKKEKVADAGGQLIGAAFNFLGEMFTKEEETEQISQLTNAFKERLSECTDKDESGKITLKVTFQDESVLDNMAKSLAGLLNFKPGEPL
ncbi:MAG: DEAD/DEAH box helicase [Desulfobacteraceae bacterium]|jgi:SNF2 family DNA or RNA helicase